MTWLATFTRPYLEAVNGYGYVQLRLHFKADLYPFYPPRVSLVGPARFCSPRRRMPFITRNKGSKRVGRLGEQYLPGFETRWSTQEMRVHNALDDY